jgi:hypothetical protein
MAFLAAVVCGCEESKRFEINYTDTTPPGKPEYIGYKPLYGGARLYFNAPEDEDLLSVDAAYTNQKGEEVWFSVSYYTDSISVYGFADDKPKDLRLYAVDRAGNRSENVKVTVEPLEPAVTRIIASAFVRGGFGSFYVDWQNELMQNINMYVDFSFNQNGEKVERHVIFSSPDPAERRFIRMEDFSDTEPVNVRMHVEDRYGNVSVVNEENIFLIHDEIIPKDKWTMPKTNDSIGGVPQAFLNGQYRTEGTILIDNIIDNGDNFNFVVGSGLGRTGNIEDGALPANVMIDLGEEWELSRIVTWQRYYWGGVTTSTGRGEYYLAANVKTYRLYVWDETQQWDSVRTHTIPTPVDLTPRQYVALGKAGDLAYFYPDELKFSKPTRWFRYEMLKSFEREDFQLSEITLYGRKKK